MNSPTVRLAFGASSNGVKAVRQGHIAEAGALISFYYLKQFLKVEPHETRNWVMDSGAFSAHNSGAEIKVDDYIKTCGEMIKADKKLVEIFALDVIGDHEASLLNAEMMWQAGVPAIPCYHAGEPWEMLTHIAAHYPKIAIGGVARKGEEIKIKFAEQCFARVWPKKIHGFGMSSEAIVMGFPFHSVDSSSWELAPQAFGNWLKFKKMEAKAKNFPDGYMDLRSQVKYFLDLEGRARGKWSKEMELLEQIEQTETKQET